MKRRNSIKDLSLFRFSEFPSNAPYFYISSSSSLFCQLSSVCCLQYFVISVAFICSAFLLSTVRTFLSMSSIYILLVVTSFNITLLFLLLIQFSFCVPCSSVYLSMQFFSSSLLFGGLVGFRVIFISHNMNVHAFCVVASFSLFARFLYCLCSSVRPTAAIPLETTNTIPCTTNILSLRFSAELQFSVSYLNYPRLNGTRIVYFCSICSAFKFCD